MDLKKYLRDIPDFPQPGILFRDITPLLKHPPAFREAIDQFKRVYQDQSIDVIVAAEARGFIFGAPLALELGVAFVPVRKPGKLPYETIAHEYELEYGRDKLEVHVDGVEAGQRVLIVDDLLATGGTVEACCHLLERTQAQIVGCAFVIELKALKGAAKLSPHPVHSLVVYD